MPAEAPTQDMTTTTARAVNAIRALTIDASEEAGSGHPGMPMGTADIGYVLYARIMNQNPQDPHWYNRDRYIQSAGHGSMLQYSLLHLMGYPDMTMDEIKKYRVFESQTPGHPEVHHTKGVEMTTGPLGQGLGTAPGFALAEQHLAARYNKPGFDIFDHYTYVIASDGDIMEGVSAEASSLAGHWGLGKLIVLYDDNQITLDADADVSFTEDTIKRYNAYGWHTQEVSDGHDPDAIEAAINKAKEVTDKPSIIAVRTIIGYGSPTKAGTSKAHGSVLGDDEAAATKKALGIDWDEFSVPDDVKSHYAEAAERGAKTQEKWNEMFSRYEQEYPELAKELKRVMAGELPEGLGQDMPSFPVGEEIATRNASGKALNTIAKQVPELLGGSADLAGSTKTDIEDTPVIQKGNYSGRNIYFGVREHAMTAIANGLSLHGGLRPFVGTFLIFSDYLRPSLRLGALMETPTIFVFTHDSVGLGADGPTHQPIAALMSLRAIPNVTLIRPADGNETSQAWVEALKHTDGPTVLVFSRQNLPNLDVPANSVEKGAYILADSDGVPDTILIATGSEVNVCLDAKKTLDDAGVKTRVVSMPSVELFEAQNDEYKEQVLPGSVKARVAVEAGASQGWYKYVGLDGAVIGIDHFGASADGEFLLERYGFSAENIAKTVQGILK